jgi:prolipoprotein diacylglyceryltransferase
MWCLIGFILLGWLSKRRYALSLDGDLFCASIIWYAVGRGLIEFLRLDAWVLGPIAAAQLFAVLAILAMVAVIVWRHRQQLSDPAAADAKAGEPEVETSKADVRETNDAELER